MPLEEVSRYLGHSSTMATRRYAQQTTESLGVRAAAGLSQAGLVAGSGWAWRKPVQRVEENPWLQPRADL
jgi:hypothetical protein